MAKTYGDLFKNVVGVPVRTQAEKPTRDNDNYSRDGVRTMKKNAERLGKDYETAAMIQGAERSLKASKRLTFKSIAGGKTC
jgi:hypothetical protein